LKPPHEKSNAPNVGPLNTPKFINACYSAIKLPNLSGNSTYTIAFAINNLIISIFTSSIESTITNTLEKSAEK
jgi:hypothetical protein